MDTTADLDRAAWLLVDIAGPASQHIEMSRSGPKKYYTVARPLTLNDARGHLRGTTTRGALCQYTSGQTRALAYDADDPEHWALLQAAARQLAQAGYRPLLEPSPKGRGGHLWLIYNALVDAQAARHQAHRIAPELAQIGEYWPGPVEVRSWNRVRLPAGRYVAPGGFAVWCRLYNAAGRMLAHDGGSAAPVLLAMQTPAALVPDAPSAPDQPPERHTRPTVTPPVAPQPDRPPFRNTPTRNRFLWFQYTPTQLANWFNERHTLEELRPTARGGMAFSPSVQEQTPSTAYRRTERGERWTDFSRRARQADGQPDGGDALELYIRLQARPRSTVLSALGREMVREACAELETAARGGTEPAGWVAAIMTPAGWEHYRALAGQRWHQDNDGRNRPS